MGKFEVDGDKLIVNSKGEQLWIEPWGANSIRVRGTMTMTMDTSALMEWALLPQSDATPVIDISCHRTRQEPPFIDELGGGMCKSGADNEVWSYGEEAYEILVKYLFIRERLKPYIKELMRVAHKKGTPPMRPLFYDFPDDGKAWTMEDQYKFGPDILVAPILDHGQRVRQVYIPAGATWKNAATGEVVFGGAKATCAAAIEIIPLFIRDDADLSLYE